MLFSSCVSEPVCRWWHDWSLYVCGPAHLSFGRGHFSNIWVTNKKQHNNQKVKKVSGGEWGLGFRGGMYRWGVLFSHRMAQHFSFASTEGLANCWRPCSTRWTETDTNATKNLTTVCLNCLCVQCISMGLWWDGGGKRPGCAACQMEATASTQWCLVLNPSAVGFVAGRYGIRKCWAGI